MAALVQYANGVPAISFTLEKSHTTIGRGVHNDITLYSDYISKRHAVVEVVMGSKGSDDLQYFIQDLNSTNHTYVNEQQISSRVRLKADDTILIGNEKFLFDATPGTLEEDQTQSLKLTESMRDIQQVKPDQNSESGLFSRRINRFV